MAIYSEAAKRRFRVPGLELQTPQEDGEKLPRLAGVLHEQCPLHISEACEHLVRFELGTQTGTNWTARRLPGQYDAQKVRYWPVADLGWSVKLKFENWLPNSSVLRAFVR